MTALGHLEMLYEMLTGEYVPKQNRSKEIDKHFNALVSFIRSGQCLVTTEDKELADAIHNAVRGALAERGAADIFAPAAVSEAVQALV
jgi:hypothetical protein